MQSEANTTCNYDNKMSLLRASLTDYHYYNIYETNNQKHKIIIMNLLFFFNTQIYQFI